MDKFKNFIGIDISKEYFDATILIDSKQSMHSQFLNSKKGINQFLKWIKQESCGIDNTLICMEHTGIYNRILVDVLFSKAYPIWVEMSYRIIRSSGIQRGKNDKVDSERIARYAMKNQGDVNLFKGTKKVLDKIQALLGQREMMIAHKTALQVGTNELKTFDAEIYKVLSKNNRTIIKEYDKALKNIDEQLEVYLKQNQEIEKIYRNITSVPGVGRVTALYLICFTNACTSFESPRQLASYCGVVPFEHTSGKSIRGKPRVHYMANKRLKKLLHLCALSSIQYNTEMKAYFDRKVQEGKHKMLVINNIRNKLLHRICASIRDNRSYSTHPAA